MSRCAPSNGATPPSGAPHAPLCWLRSTGSVLRYSGTTGVFVDTFVPSGSGGLVTPSALIFGPDSNLYVASSFVVGDVLGFGVLRYSGTTGVFIDIFVSSGSGGLDFPTDLVFGHDGGLYVTSFFTDSVLRYSGTTGA